MEQSEIKCLEHQSTLLGLCISPECENRMVCCKCATFGHKTCKENIIFFEDLESLNIPNVFKLNLFKHVIGPKVIEHGISSRTKDYFINQCSNLFSNFLDKLTNLVSEYESQVTDEMAKADPIEGFEEEVKRIVNFEELRNFITTKSVEEMVKTVDELDIISKRDEVLSSLKNYRDNLKDNLKFMNSIRNLEDQLNEVSTIIKSRLDFQRLFNSEYRFDTNKSNMFHKISHENKVITHSGLDNTSAATFINFIMHPDSGIYTWKVRFDGLIDIGNGKNYWGSMGILEEEFWEIGRENFSFSSPISYCTDNTFYGGAYAITNEIPNQLEGKVITLTYDTSSCELTITHNDQLKIVGTGKAGVSYKPIILTYRDGNQCTLVEE